MICVKTKTGRSGARSLSVLSLGESAPSPLALKLCFSESLPIFKASSKISHRTVLQPLLNVDLAGQSLVSTPHMPPQSCAKKHVANKQKKCGHQFTGCSNVAADVRPHGEHLKFVRCDANVKPASPRSRPEWARQHGLHSVRSIVLVGRRERKAPTRYEQTSPDIHQITNKKTAATTTPEKCFHKYLLSCHCCISVRILLCNRLQSPVNCDPLQHDKMDTNLNHYTFSKCFFGLACVLLIGRGGELYSSAWSFASCFALSALQQRDSG